LEDGFKGFIWAKRRFLLGKRNKQLKFFQVWGGIRKGIGQKELFLLEGKDYRRLGGLTSLGCSKELLLSHWLGFYSYRGPKGIFVLREREGLNPFGKL